MNFESVKDGGGRNLAMGVQSSRVNHDQDCLHVSNSSSYWTPCMTIDMTFLLIIILKTDLCENINMPKFPWG